MLAKSKISKVSLDVTQSIRHDESIAGKGLILDIVTNAAVKTLSNHLLHHDSIFTNWVWED